MSIDVIAPAAWPAIDDGCPVTAIAAVRTGTALKNNYDHKPSLRLRADYLSTARAVRADYLGKFLEAHFAAVTLGYTLNTPLDREVALMMVGAMYHAIGAKAGDDVEGMVAGCVDLLIEGDEVADATELWTPLQVSPFTLSIAARKLITESAQYVPRPGALYVACREARRALVSARRAAEDVADSAVRADAIMLAFAPPNEWRAPWLSAALQPTLRRMLGIHHTNVMFGGLDEDLADDDPNLLAYRSAVERELAELGDEEEEDVCLE
jgi:hypothetical protein